MLYLQERGYLSAEKNKIVDIGPQNVYHCTEAQILSFVQRQGAVVDEETLRSEARRLEYFSTPRPQERTTLFSEIADLANIEYHAFDVCLAPKTELLDLNFDSLPERHREYFDVVLNFGTTEHIFNQLNCFAVIHDAAKVGGIIYCVLPATGYLDHGYFCYTPLFFSDMARANEYEIVGQFFTLSGTNTISALGFDLRDAKNLFQKVLRALAPNEDVIRCLDAHILMRKTSGAPLRLALEVATSHSSANESAAGRYSLPIEVAALQRECLHLRAEVQQCEAARAQCEVEKRKCMDECDALHEAVQRIYSSTSWRLTAPLRAARAALRSIAHNWP